MDADVYFQVLGVKRQIRGLPHVLFSAPDCGVSEKWLALCRDGPTMRSGRQKMACCHYRGSSLPNRPVAAMALPLTLSM